jgi:predicted permease
MSPREIWFRLTYPLRKSRMDRELREELSLHVALRTEQLMDSGIAPEAAVAAARKRFGNQPRIAAAARGAWGWTWLDGVAQDARYFLRQMRRTPTFALVVCATIALGVAINATAFTFYDAVVLKPLPVEAPQQVVRITQEGRAFGFELLPFAGYEVLHRDARTLQSVAATTAPQSVDVVLPGHGSNDSRVVAARFVTPDFARVLGVHASIGRWFDASDDVASCPCAVLDHTFWTTALNADPTVVGQSMRVGNATLTIVGIAPETFAGTGMPAVAPALWLPSPLVPALMGADLRNDGRPHWQVLGRLAPGGSRATVSGELAVLSRSIRDTVGKPLPLVVRTATFFQTDAGEFEAFQQASIAFLAALALMLSIAVVNLVNLFAARNAAREREVAVRLALGASRRRIARQLASESVILAVAGGAFGLIASRAFTLWIERWMMSTVSSISAGILDLSLDVRIDWRVAAYTAVLSLGIGLAVGLWPALRASRGDVNAVLRQGAATTSGAVWSKRHLLLAMQIASCTVLLTGAGALLGGMRLSNAVDPHFDADHMLVVDVQDDAPTAERTTRRGEIAQRLGALAAVRAVAWTHRVPFSGTHLRRVSAPGGDVTVGIDEVSESYFDALGLSIVRGRGFTRDEVDRGAPVMVISATAARLRWPHGDAIGRSVSPNDPLAGPDSTKAYTVVGIVPDIRSQFLSRPDGPAVYFPYGQGKQFGAFLARTRRNPAVAVAEVRAAIASLAPSLANRTHVITMEDGPMALQRLMAQTPAMIALVLALAGLCLASVGVYGVVSQIVTRRTREIGIHIALGAGRYRVLWLVANKTLRPVMWGALIGGAGAVGLVFVLRSLIAMPDVPDLTFGAGAFNPVVLAGVAGALLLVVAAAFVMPARRAASVDPVRALQAE